MEMGLYTDAVDGKIGLQAKAGMLNCYKVCDDKVQIPKLRK